MKKNRLFVSLFASGLLFVAPAMAQDVVKLTTSKAIGESVTLQVNQLKKGATVDWGDGIIVEVTKTSDDNLTIEGQLKGQTITITSPSKITTLVCESLDLTNIDLTNATNLCSLYCQNNSLTTLDVSKCKALTDLNCSNNQLTKLTITSTSHPSIENLNVSGNELKNVAGNSSTTFSYNSSSLQHLDISNNTFATISIGSAKNTDVFNCDGNNLTTLSIAPMSKLSVLTCNNNKLKTVNLSATKSSLRQIFAQNNVLTKLSLSDADVLHYVAVDNNQLETITLPEKQKIYAFTCGNNKLTVGALPAPQYVTNIIYTPQDLEYFDVSSALTKDATTGLYYALVAPSKTEARKSPYLRDFTNWMLDGSGSRTLTAQFMGKGEGDNEVRELERNKDYYMATTSSNYGKVGFLVPLSEVYLTLSSSSYPDLIQRSTSFVTVKDVSDLTGIDDVIADSPSGISVSTSHGNIVVSATGKQNVTIHDASGKLVWAGVVDGSVTISQPSGVYIVNGQKVVI